MLRVGDRVQVKQKLRWSGGKQWSGMTGVIVKGSWRDADAPKVVVKFDNAEAERQMRSKRIENVWWEEDLELDEVSPEEIRTAIQSITGKPPPFDLADALRRRLQEYDEILAMPDQDDAIATIDLVDDLRRMLRQTE